MIRSILLSELGAKFSPPVDLSDSIFSVQIELREVVTGERHPDPRTWVFNELDDIMEPEV